MTDRQFPPEFEQLIRATGVRAAFVSENTSPHPADCKNCGGLGTLNIFIATIGPLQSPAVGRNIITKWSDGKWWGGKTYEFDCPVCHSLALPYRGTPSVFERDKQVSEQIALLAEGWAVKDV
jgi:hypothetical protein